MTYNEVLEKAFDSGNNQADVALGRMMVVEQEETGTFPNWDDTAPDWILDLFGFKRGCAE